ncbi:MAG: DEAD/DEAH box helicase [Acidimicrobiales bacterium]
MDDEWAWCLSTGESVRVIDRSELWGTPVCDVISQVSGRVHRLASGDLAPLTTRRWTPDEVVWRAAGARAIALVAAGEPLATRSAGVELLPHQLATLERAMTTAPARLALCDEVGLGKTITAAAIFAELKARKLIQRTLVVAPKGVQLQWVAELAERFGEEFVRVGPEGLPVDAGFDPWKAFDQVVCSFDAVKPLRARAGWDPKRVAEHNALRFRAVTDAGWDLVIVDEAHHVAGSSEDVARHRLARELAAAPNCLLLSATPHSGKSDGFRRFLGLLDDGFLHGKPLDRVNVARVVARAEKRTALDNSGRALFTTRTTQIQVVPYGDRSVERVLYEAVTDYVRDGYGRSVRERRPAVGFLVLLMQRLVSSSTTAIRTALERRVATLDTGASDQLRLFEDDWSELTGEEQFNALAAVRGAAWATERHEVERLCDLARQAESAGRDAKALFFLELLRRIQREEGDPGVKVLVFTEFVATQEMALDLLANAGVEAVSINGSMALAERALAQEAFRTTAQVLVSTDAGGEGINLQFAHVVVNWDLPWSPSRLEQRVGRVDRIGQRQPVRAFNLVAESSVDARVLDVLDQKLAVILAEFGADKRGDILETASGHTEAIYAGALTGDTQFEESAELLLERTRAELRDQAGLRDLLPSDPGRPRTSGEKLRTALSAAALAWERHRGRAGTDPMEALDAMPSVAPGEPVPEISGSEPGWWGVWEVRADASSSKRSAFTVFVPDAGGVRPDAAERVWEALARVTEVRTIIVPPPDAWDQLARTALDYAYRPCAELVGGNPPPLPAIRPLLIARVTP